jgi:hypothetical protein
MQGTEADSRSLGQAEAITLTSILAYIKVVLLIASDVTF